MQKNVEHIALHVLYDFVIGVSPLQDEAKLHYDSCETCQKESAWLHELDEFGQHETAFEPPDWAIANATKVFKLKKPAIVRFAEQIVANLVFDSFNEPLPHGVRRRDLPARQALYQAGNLQLDLKIQLLGEDEGAIMGQIVSEDSNVSVERLQVSLVQGEIVISTSRTNAMGEFIFEGVPRGSYEVKIHLEDKTLSLPPLPMGNC